MLLLVVSVLQPYCRCLCYPQVLYRTLAKASESSNVDALGILNKCRKQHSGQFQTQWATAVPTACPAIPLSARVTDVISLAGPATLLPSGDVQPTWAWPNLLQWAEVPQITADPSVFEEAFGMRALKLLMLVFLSAPPIFLALHVVLSRGSSVYRSLAAADRMVVCQHSVYAVVFGLSMVPQTVLAFTALFKSWTGDFFSSSQLPILAGVFIGSRLLLYLVEACVRCVIKGSWLLVVHHLMFFLFITIGMWAQSVTVFGIGLVLDLCACWEAPLYLALVAYRLQWQPSLTRALMCVATAWYVATRVFQTVVVTYMIVGFAGLGAMQGNAALITGSVMFCAFTAIQVYTVFIYYAMYRKVSKKGGAGTTAAGARCSSPDGTCFVGQGDGSVDAPHRDQGCLEDGNGSGLASVTKA